MNENLYSRLEFEVRGFDCGYGGPLRTFALANFLQESAGVNATRLGFGMEELHARGWTWMLSRIDLRVDELPRDGERIVVRTWPGGTRKLFALRDFAMSGADGRSLVRAVYAYLIVDMTARRPLRPQSVFGQEPPNPGEAPPVPDFSFDIPAALNPAAAFVQPVRSRHIDHNGHANNAHILNWLVDASAEERTEGDGERLLSALRVEFLAEALEGDELEATRGRPELSPFGPEAAALSTTVELLRGDTKVARALVGRR
jgi:medium-chain acyl-[acyl-carrier-protein] hydrolase